MRKVSDEVEEGRVRFAPLSGKSGNCRMAADDLEDEIQILQAGEERRGSCASQANGCCFDPAMVEQVLACDAVHAEHHIKAMREEFTQRFKAPAAPEQLAGEEREEWEGDRDDENAAGGRYEGATLGLAVDPARHQDANGGSGGGGHVSTPRNGLHARDSSRSRAGNETRRKRMNPCYKGWREGQHWQNEQ